MDWNKVIDSLLDTAKQVDAQAHRPTTRGWLLRALATAFEKGLE